MYGLFVAFDLPIANWLGGLYLSFDTFYSAVVKEGTDEAMFVKMTNVSECEGRQRLSRMDKKKHAWV